MLSHRILHRCWYTLATPLCIGARELTTPDRLWRYPLILLAVTAGLYAVRLARATGVIESNGDLLGRDYFAFYMAGDLVNRGCLDDLYSAPAHTAYQQAFMRDINPVWSGTYPYRNPPHYAWAMSWLARLGYGPSLIAWSALSLLCFAATVLIWRAWFVESGEATVGRYALPGPKHRAGFALTVMLAVCMPSWFQALAGGQNTFISLLILTAFCALLVRGRDGWAGLVLSLLAYKFYLIAVPALVLAAKRRWRAVGGVVLGGALTLALTAATMGPGIIMDYLHYAPSQARLMEEGGFDVHKQHCWHGFFELLGAGWMPRASSRILAATASVASLALLIPVWRGPWEPRRPAFRLKLAATVVALLLTSPHLLHYDVLMAVLPAALWYSAAHPPARRESPASVKLILLAGFCWLAVAEPLARVTNIQLSPLLMLWWLVALGKRCQEKGCQDYFAEKRCQDDFVGKMVSG